MGRADQRKKAGEQFLIREFVRNALGYAISLPVWGESPDAILTLRKGRSKWRVAIEHTGYFNDTTAEKSSISDFWKRVQTSLGRRISHRKHLADVMGTVELHTKRFARRFDRKTLAAQLAREIVDFMEIHPTARSERFPSHSATSRGTEFCDFPALDSMVASIRLERIPGIDYFSRHHWRCLNISTGPIGLDLNCIRTVIENKTQKATKYNWQLADEKWLLIATAGDYLSTHVGEPKERDWNDPELRALCRASPFDRIYFWERIRRWYVLLQPEFQIVRTADANDGVFPTYEKPLHGEEKGRKRG